MNNKEIYLIGIGGIAMGTLACMFQKRGHSVRGSDNHIYPPMSGILASSGIRLYEGFSHNNIGTPDLVIVGNAISRGNPELEYVLDNNIPYMSMAGALKSFFLADKEIIAVCGTHGKTTTTALLAHILATAGLSPSFFIGGVARNYNTNYMLDKGPYFVIEGDEYDSAFFEKVPKFMVYRPRHVILTSLEFDHADIYSGIEEIELWFKRLINIIPAQGSIVYSSEYPSLQNLILHALSHTTSFGTAGAEAWYEFLEHTDEMSRIRIHTGESTFDVETVLFGHINFVNILGAVVMALKAGGPVEAVKEAVASFRGVKRRQELIFHSGNIRIYEDFAHHPTAIHGVLETIKDRFPEARIWAVYEPRSATSRRNIFQNELSLSFKSAHEVMIKYPYKSEALDPGERLDVDAVCTTITATGGNARAFHKADEIIAAVVERIDCTSQNIIVIMSNGAFDGIYTKIISEMNRIFSDNLCLESSN